MSTKSPCLDFVVSVSLPEIERFAAKDHFIVDTSENAPVKIGELDTDFRHLITLVDENIPPAVLEVHRLLEDSFDIEIMSGLKAPHTNISHLYQLLMLQPRGEPGALLLDIGNLFYIFGPRGDTWAISPYWHSGKDYWEIKAFETDDRIKWPQGFHVVSMRWYVPTPAL